MPIAWPSRRADTPYLMSAAHRRMFAAATVAQMEAKPPLTGGTRRLPPTPPREGKKYPYIDTW